MGTQKNRLDETVLLGTQNICMKLRVRKYLQFYAQKLCLSKPMNYNKAGTVTLLQFENFLNNKIVQGGGEGPVPLPPLLDPRMKMLNFCHIFSVLLLHNATHSKPLVFRWM